jgi:hypothetical protein
MSFLHRYRNNDPIHRHANQSGIRDFVDGPLPGFGSGGPSPQPSPQPAKRQRLTHAEMPHNSGKRIDALHDALTEMHDRGVIDLFSIMANHLGSLDADDLEDPELRDLHETAHGWADGDRNT